jgi:RimJ/RimL family protein N-acetyltransferase
MKHRHYVYPDQKLETIGRLYPEYYETAYRLKDGSTILVRPIKPTDERLLQDFFYSHSEDTIFQRYHAHVKTMHHTKAQDLANVDYKTRMAFIAVLGEIGQERIIAVGRYVASEDGRLPEIAFVVHEDYRGKGLAGYLYRQLQRVAQDNGFDGFEAYVLPDNYAMLRVFERVGGATRKFDDGLFRFAFKF